MQWDCTVKNNKCSVTHKLLVMGWNAMRLHDKEKQMQCHSLPVGHGMKCNETAWQRKTDAVSLTGCWSCNEMQWDCMVKKNKCSVTHWLLVMGWNAMRLHGKENAVSLTGCWSWDEMQWDYMVKKNKCSVTHKLLVMGWNAMRLHGKEKQMQCHSQTVGHGMKCNETAW